MLYGLCRDCGRAEALALAAARGTGDSVAPLELPVVDTPPASSPADAAGAGTLTSPVGGGASVAIRSGDGAGAGSAACVAGLACFAAADVAVTTGFTGAGDDSADAGGLPVGAVNVGAVADALPGAPGAVDSTGEAALDGGAATG